VIVVRADSPYKDLKDLLQKQLQSKSPLSYGSMGTGTSNHIGMEVLSKISGMPLSHVPYKGSAPALSDLLGGHVDMVTDTLVATLPHIRAGKLRALAVFGSERPKVQDIPTISELVGKPVEMYSWFGLVAPKGTPPDVIQMLNKAVMAALANPKIASDLEPLGVMLRGSTPAQFDAFADEQRKLYGNMIKTYKLELK
jgi:tripartite-type tricarboxylate transporter receptor subunit TctC